MKLKRKNPIIEFFKSSGGVFTFLVFFIVGIIFVNQKITKIVNQIDQGGSYTFLEVANEVRKKTKEEMDKQKAMDPGFLENGGKVTRVVTMSDLNGDEFLSQIYRGTVKIAEFKESNGKIFDLNGEIPDGKVEIINNARGTYGEENYENGERNGPYLEYYKESHSPRIKAQFYKGKLIHISEYYLNGTLKGEMDLKNTGN